MTKLTLLLCASLTVCACTSYASEHIAAPPNGRLTKDEQGNTALHTLAQNNKDSAILVATVCPAELNERNNNNKLPYELARENGHTDLAGILQALYILKFPETNS